MYRLQHSILSLAILLTIFKQEAIIAALDGANDRPRRKAARRSQSGKRCPTNDDDDEDDDNNDNGDEDEDGNTILGDRATTTHEKRVRRTVPDSDDEGSGADKDWDDDETSASESEGDDNVNEEQEAKTLDELMNDAMTNTDNIALERIAPAQPYHDTYDIKNSRKFFEWTLKVEMLATIDDADPVACLADIPEIYQEPDLGVTKNIPDMVNSITSTFELDRIRYYVPPNEEVRKQTKDLPKRYSLESYLRDSLQKAASSTTKIIDLSKSIYGIHHGNGKQRYTKIVLKHDKHPYTTADNFQFNDMNRYREALDNTLPYISQTLLQGDVKLEYAIPYTLNDIEYATTTRSEDIIMGYKQRYNAGAQVHNVALRLKWKGLNKEKLLPIAIDLLGSLPITDRNMREGDTCADRYAKSASQLCSFGRADPKLQGVFAGCPIVVFTDILPFYTVRRDSPCFQGRQYARICLVKNLQVGDRLIPFNRTLRKQFGHENKSN